MEYGQMMGLLVINKPAGMTSRDVVNRVQRITRIKKCGHAGTLDPLATGVLVVCLGQGTRLVPYVQSMPKRYRAGFRFGWRSNTDDIEGELQAVESARFPTMTELSLAMNRMEGFQEQMPPQFSAKKVQGRRAYDVARQGEVVELTPQTVRIDELRLLDYLSPDWNALITCGSGTYVRSIGRDLGEEFGCGAIMTSLVREAIGAFTLDNACTLEELEQGDWRDHLQKAAAATTALPQHHCSAEELRHLQHGRRISVPGFQEAEEVALLDQSGNLAAIAIVQESGQLKPRHVFIAGNG